MVIAKPILVLILPDKVHASMIRFSHWVGSKKYFRKLMKRIFIGKRNVKLEQKYFGIDFKSPVGLSAGFDKNAEIIPTISSLGFGFGVVGSVTAKMSEGNPRPWFYRLPAMQSLIVNSGFASHGSNIVIDRIKKCSQGIIYKFPITVSVAQTNIKDVHDEKTGIEDYAATIKQVKNIKNIKMIELNISCPNPYGGVSFNTPDRLEQLLTAIDKIKISKPIFVKLSADLSWHQAQSLLDVIINHRIAGVILSDLAIDLSNVEINQELPREVQGRLSGRPIRWLSNELIRRTYKNYGDKLLIIGVGGIFSAEDAYIKIKFGASLVELITGLMIYGPQLAAEINDDLVKLIEADGYTDISQAIGVDVLKYMKD